MGTLMEHQSWRPIRVIASVVLSCCCLAVCLPSTAALTAEELAALPAYQRHFLMQQQQQQIPKHLATAASFSTLSSSSSLHPSSLGHTATSSGAVTAHRGHHHSDRNHISASDAHKHFAFHRNGKAVPDIFAAVGNAAAYGNHHEAAQAQAAGTAEGSKAGVATAAAAAAGAGNPVIIGPVSLPPSATGMGKQVWLRENGMKPTAKRPKGSCSSLKQVYIINITKPSDFAFRKRLPPTASVVLYLKNNLQLPQPLLFDRSFSCTILMSSAWPGFTISSPRTTEPLLKVWETHNVAVFNVNWKSAVRTVSPACESVPELGKNEKCPTVSVYKSYGVQIGMGYMFGRIDVFRSMNVRVDSLKITGPSEPDWGHPGNIRVAMSGFGPDLLGSNIVIQNNNAYGTYTPIVLHRGAIGVRVIHNWVHDYGFAGIRCGADVHFVGDCMLANINNNVVMAIRRNMSGDSDAAGIYFCTHWFNPGNRALCNYVFNGDHCYYLDYCTSAVTVRGGGCINTWDGMKVNNGKKNIIMHVAMKGQQRSPGWVTCLTVKVNNCLKDPGLFWERMRQKYYNTPRINKLWPWMRTVCGQTQVGGVPCNNAQSLPASTTGKCSGIGTENFINLVLVNTTGRNDQTIYCEDSVPHTARLNSISYVTPRSAGWVQFRNYKRNDLAIKKTSPLLKRQPKYLSCPRSLSGPRRFSQSSYFWNFNIPKPVGMDKVVEMDAKHIIDHKLIPKTVKAMMAANPVVANEYSWLSRENSPLVLT